MRGVSGSSIAGSCELRAVAGSSSRPWSMEGWADSIDRCMLRSSVLIERRGVASILNRGGKFPQQILNRVEMPGLERDEHSTGRCDWHALHHWCQPYGGHREVRWTVREFGIE